MYRLCIRCCSQEKGNKEDIEDGDEEKGEQAVHGEVELERGDAGDQVGHHLEEVGENGLIHLEEVKEIGLVRDLVEVGIVRVEVRAVLKFGRNSFSKTLENLIPPAMSQESVKL